MIVLAICIPVIFQVAGPKQCFGYYGWETHGSRIHCSSGNLQSGAGDLVDVVTMVPPGSSPRIMRRHLRNFRHSVKLPYIFP